MAGRRQRIAEPPPARDLGRVALAGPSACALLASNERQAVVFRRGPSKWVLQVAWDLARDTFVEGQWLRARIYDAVSDLSPDGKLLLYHAAKYQRDERTPLLRTYTAVSKPPYFTALALWRETYDAYGGWTAGGRFDAPRSVLLTNAKAEAQRVRGVPFVIQVRYGSEGPAPAGFHRRGWTLHDAGGPWSLDEHWHGIAQAPAVYVKPQPRERGGRALRRFIHGTGADTPWYADSFALVTPGARDCPLDQVEWADWDANGDLLFSRGAVLFRVLAARLVHGLREALQLLDLRDRRYVARLTPPDYAQEWQWPRRGGRPSPRR